MAADSPERTRGDPPAGPRRNDGSRQSRSRYPATHAFVVGCFAVLGLANLVPQIGRVALEAALVVLLLSLWLRRLRRHEALVLAGVVAVGAWWALAIFNSNVPDVATGALGWRKSVLVFIGVGLGYVLFGSRRSRLERDLIRILTAGLMVSIAIHLFAPGVEQGINREADRYTAELGGTPRLQGIFAGPFHVALAGSMLVAWGFARRRLLSVLSATAIAVGTAAVLLAGVRTAYVALAVAACFAIWRQSSFARRARLAALVVGGVLVGLLGLAPLVGLENTAIESLASFQSDQRFENRFDTWNAGLEMVWERPIAGHGAGSAGDTLGSRFGDSRQHVTAHNAALSWAVEGGLAGLFLATGLSAIVLWPLLRSRDPRLLPAQLVALIVGVFGLTGAIVGAQPVALLAGALVGAAGGARSQLA